MAASRKNPSRAFPWLLVAGALALVVVLFGLRREAAAPLAEDSPGAGRASPVVADPDAVAPPSALETLTTPEPEAAIEAPPEIRSDDPDVKSWGKPILVGDVRLPDDRVARQKIYRTQQKYPLMMQQQIWKTVPGRSQVGEYLGERKMVADHLVVRLKDPDAAASFESRLPAGGLTVRKRMYANDMYLVTFPVSSAQDFQRAQDYLSSLPEVSSVNPDIFGRSF
jgi:hypothetical protein